MKVISVATKAAARQMITKPRWLVQFGTVPIIRLSSGTPISWQGSIWPLGRFEVSNLGETSTFNDSARISLLNTEIEYTGAMLAGGIVGKRVQIWQFFADAVASDDPVLRFDGLGFQLELSDSGIMIEARTPDSSVQYSPRQRVSKTAGFNHLSSPGQRIFWSGEYYTLTSPTE